MQACAHKDERVDGIAEGGRLRWKCAGCGRIEDRPPKRDSYALPEPVRWAEPVPAEPEVTRTPHRAALIVCSCGAKHSSNPCTAYADGYSDGVDFDQAITGPGAPP